MNAPINVKKDALLGIILGSRDSAPKSRTQLIENLQAAGITADTATQLGKHFTSIAQVAWTHNADPTYLEHVKPIRNDDKPLGLQFQQTNNMEIPYSNLPLQFRKAFRADLYSKMDDFLEKSPEITDQITLG